MEGVAAAAAEVVKQGDYVVLYGGIGAIDPHRVVSGAKVQTAYGEFALDELVGHPYGQRFFSSKGVPGFVYPLRATPELLTSGGLVHRTQVIHSSDVSYITFALGLRAGHVVVEAGTGSGSLTNALARITGDTGRVFSFEFHADRAQQARQTFETIGNAGRIVVTHRDVCAEGFLLPPQLEAGGADAVFLDVPSPWLGVAHAHAALRPQGSLACYSPCLEQVEKTCEAMRAAGMLDVTTVEIRQHPWDSDLALRSRWNGAPAAAAAAAAAADEARPTKKPKKKGPPERVDKHDADAMLLLKPKIGETPGHTAFLTFCKKRV